MQIIEYRSFGKDSSGAPRRKTPAIVITILIVAVSAFLYFRRGPSVNEVKNWMSELPQGATKPQVMALFANKKIGSTGDETPIKDEPGFYYIHAYIYCEDDRAIAILAKMTNDGHFVKAFVSQGYRGW